MTREKAKRAAYTLEYKLEAVQLVKGGQAKSVTAKVLGIPRKIGSQHSSNTPHDGPVKRYELQGGQLSKAIAYLPVRISGAGSLQSRTLRKISTPNNINRETTRYSSNNGIAKVLSIRCGT